MKKLFCLFGTLVVLVSCAHMSPSERTPAQSETTQATTPPPLKPEEITVWNLQKLAQSGRADILNELFNNYGLPIQRLPEGYAAGAGARVLNLKTPLFTKLIDDLTGANWRGKIFFPSENPRKSMGLNRIMSKFKIRPMASFVTELVPKHPLAPEAKSPLVTLNYAKPETKNYWQEIALTQIEVYDLMVAVQGAYGPVFIGKTWLGSYAKDRSFTPHDGDKLIAWFFLDFNAKALSVQAEQYWDGAREDLMKDLPRMTDQSMPVMPAID